VAFSIDAYWLEFLFFLPFVVTWCLYARLPLNRALFWSAIVTTAGVCIKGLCGFEYVSNIAGAVAVPALYFGLKSGLSRAGIIRHILVLAFAAVVGFVVALTIQIGQVSALYGHAGIQKFEQRASYRTSGEGEGMSMHYDEAVQRAMNKLHVPVTVQLQIVAPAMPAIRLVLRYMLYQGKSALSLSGEGRTAIPIGVFSGAAFLVAVLAFIRRRERFFLMHKPAIGAILLAFLVSNSWAVMANGHMTHTFLNAIIFYIPFLPVMFVFLSLFIVGAFNRVWSIGRSYGRGT
jgi:hypothetical protein